ncbi:MAG: PorV/PorQ family protein [Gemmatimonadota bacterium]|nr:PorV/PorQ family protein [Gemmatimonadota bacterium]
MSVVGALLLAVRPAAAQSDPAEREDAGSAAETAAFLLVPIGARSTGMGGAVAAARGDVEGALWNPASLAGLEGGALFASGADDFAATATSVGAVVAVARFRFGASYFRYDLGEIDARDAANADIGTIEPAHGALIVTAARRVLPWLDVGANWKLVRLAADCSGPCEAFDDTGSGSAFDVGAVAEPPGAPGVRIGVLLRNLGGGIGVSGGPEDALPARGRVGLEVSVPEAAGAAGGWSDGQVDLVARLDLQETLTEFDDLDVHAGLELAWRGLLLARAGYAASTDGRTGPTLGIGLRWERLTLDLARSFDDFSRFESGSPFQLSLAIGL